MQERDAQRGSRDTQRDIIGRCFRGLQGMIELAQRCVVGKKQAAGNRGGVFRIDDKDIRNRIRLVCRSEGTIEVGSPAGLT